MLSKQAIQIISSLVLVLLAIFAYVGKIALDTRTTAENNRTVLARVSDATKTLTSSVQDATHSLARLESDLTHNSAMLDTLTPVLAEISAIRTSLQHIQERLNENRTETRLLSSDLETILSDIQQLRARIE